MALLRGKSKNEKKKLAVRTTAKDFDVKRLS